MKEEVALARGQIYRLLSTALAYPGEKLQTALLDGSLVSQLNESAEKLPNYQIKRKYIQSLAASIKKHGDNVFSAIISEYLDLFGPDHKPKCPPYELVYFSRGPLFMNMAVLADIAGFYRAFGLEMADGSKDRADHISIELEFMHFLAVKEAYTLRNGQHNNLGICRDAQRKFLYDHLGRWTGVFHNQVKRNTKSGFYYEMTKLLNNFVAADSKILGIKPEKIKDTHST
jgi:DMSO reductase family type II enzyme chaperone